MARPPKFLQRKKSGVYFVQVRAGKHRLTESLGTKDEQKALTLVGPVVKRLQEQLDERDVRKTLACFPGLSDPKIEHRIRSLMAPGSLPENRKIKWVDLVREHERVFRRKNPNKKGLSSGWHEQMRIAIEQIPFTYEQTSRQRIRDWVAQMEKQVWLDGPKKGQRRLSARSLEIRCGYFQAIVETSIKSGFLPDDAQHLEQVDFAQVKLLGTTTSTRPRRGYKGIGQLLRTQDVRRRIRLVILRGLLGTRVRDRPSQPEDWNLDASPDDQYERSPFPSTRERTGPAPEQC